MTMSTHEVLTVSSVWQLTAYIAYFLADPCDNKPERRQLKKLIAGVGALGVAFGWLTVAFVG